MASGLQIIDVSTPTAPVLLGNYAASNDAIHVELSGTTAYVADLASGLQIIDVSTPAAPVLLGDYDTPDTALWVATSPTEIYVADGAAGLQILGVSDTTPEEPGGDTGGSPDTTPEEPGGDTSGSADTTTPVLPATGLGPDSATLTWNLFTAVLALMAVGGVTLALRMQRNS